MAKGVSVDGLGSVVSQVFGFTTGMSNDEE